MDNRFAKDTTDHKYFVITQRLVTALCRDPYDLSLWTVIKDICGEGGECTLSTPDLATLAMMSAGRVSNSRQYLIETGLIIGELKRDPGYPQPVWHLSIPDLWQKNIEWSLQYPTLAERIAFKTAQKLELSSGEGLKELSPHERGVPPHERKKKGIKTPKDQEDRAGAGGVVVLTQNDIRKHAEEVFTKATNLVPVGNATYLGKRWYNPLREICKLCEWDVNTITETINGAVKVMKSKPLDITAPESILGYANRYRAAQKGITPHGANGSSLTIPANIPDDIRGIWTTIPLEMQTYIVKNPSKLENFKKALISRGLY